MHATLEGKCKTYPEFSRFTSLEYNLQMPKKGEEFNVSKQP